MTTCERHQAHLNDFLDGTLPASQAQELNAHLQQCPACRAEFQALKTTQALVRAAAVPDGQAAKSRILARFHQAAQTPARPQLPPLPGQSAFWKGRPFALGMAAASACLLLLVVRLDHGGRSSNPAAESHPEGKPILIVTALCSPSLPAASDLDAMTSLHAVQSFTVLNGNEELQQEALADANSRLKPQRTDAQ